MGYKWLVCVPVCPRFTASDKFIFSFILTLLNCTLRVTVQTCEWPGLVCWHLLWFMVCGGGDVAGDTGSVEHEQMACEHLVAKS